jgi:hypothetical protein
METSKLLISEEELIKTVAEIKYPGEDEIIISINDELSIVPHRVMKHHWVSGTDKF